MNFKKFQFAGTPNSSVLAEKGEIYKSPNGQIQQIAQHAPSHDDGEQVNQFGIKSTSKGNGGVVVDADSVLSDSYSQVSTGNRKNSMKEQIVKIKPEEGEIIASQLGLDIRLKKSVSPSKLFLEIQEAKDKIALKIMKASEKTQKTRESSNALEANQAQLMSLPTDEEIYEAVFHTQEEKKESSLLDFEATENSQYGGAHYNKNLNYILPNSLLDEKNEDVEEPVFKLKKKEIKGDKRNGYSAYEQNGEIYMDNINDEPIKQHETFHYLRSKGYFSPREQAIENELLDGSIYSPLDKNKLNSDIYSPEELAARFHSISGYLPNNYKEEDFKKLWETGKDLQIQDLKQVIPYDKALYYMNNYHPSKMQMGGMVSKDSSNLKEIKKQRDWLRAWYGERDIVTEPIEIFENELKSVNGSKTKDPEILKQNEEFREWGKKTNFDVSAYYHTPSDRSVFLKDVTGTTDPIHEFTHSIDNNYGDNIGTFNSINPFHPLKTDYTKLGVKPIKENDYFTNTEETYARLNEARYSSGYAANYKPTLEDIKEQRRLNKKNKPKAYNHLFDYYDDNSIMQMWNGLSDTRFEESSVENPMLQSTAKYGIKMQFGGSTFPFTNMQKQNNISKEEKQYRNPEKKFETISTDDYALDFLYDNDWLLDTPIVGDYLKKKARSIAGYSSSQFRDKNEYNQTKDPHSEFKYTGAGKFKDGELVPGDISLVDVFFGNQNLPKSEYKPTSDYLEFLPSYSLKNKKTLDKDLLQNYIKYGFHGEVDADSIMNNFLKTKKPIFSNKHSDTDLTLGVLGANLAGHKEGIAWDKEKNLPYLSVSDAWDFEPTNYTKKWQHEESLKPKTYKQSYLLNKAGNPFKIYDRFYFDPKTKEYIPDEQLDKFKVKKKQFGGSTYVNREQKIPFIKPSAPVMRKNLMNSLGVRNVSTSYYPEMEKDVQDMISMKNEDLYNKEERKRMREQVLNDLSAQNTIYELAGKPNIGFFNDGSASMYGKVAQKILGKNRANYDVLTNTMNVRRGKESDFFAEIAHAIPGNVNTLSDNVRRPFSDIYEDGYSFEYGTHKIVEPELRKTYNWIASGGDKTNNEELKKFAVKKQFGGSSSILKQLQLL